MYYSGEGVPQDHKAALQWLRRAAEQGHAEAQLGLGGAYYEGIPGLSQDYIYAHMWANIAALGGNERAAAKLRNVEEEMTPSQIAEAEILKRECVRKAYKDC